ncbi:uncharacterized protein LOC113274854 isoform X2 [Papaver somniferum]|nr:uncharacterized protein LOC113274854 isoform X2 [Papaver somniferum]
MLSINRFTNENGCSMIDFETQITSREIPKSTISLHDLTLIFRRGWEEIWFMIPGLGICCVLLLPQNYTELIWNRRLLRHNFLIKWLLGLVTGRYTKWLLGLVTGRTVIAVMNDLMQYTSIGV